MNRQPPWEMIHNIPDKTQWEAELEYDDLDHVKAHGSELYRQRKRTTSFTSGTLLDPKYGRQRRASENGLPTFQTFLIDVAKTKAKSYFF